jgi:glycosyltransferase involved in cell wall biosynthesis
MPLHWIVAQIGARQHYAVPRALDRRGHLDVFYTDAWCRHGSALLRRGPAPLRKLAGRYHPDLPSPKVRAFTWRALRNIRRLAAEAGSTEGWTANSIGAGSTREPRPRRAAQRTRGAFFDCRPRASRRCMLGSRAVHALISESRPGRGSRAAGLRRGGASSIPDAYFERLAEEWGTASAVLVNSTWSRDALVQQGVPAAKIIIVPIAFEAAVASEPPQRSAQGTLTVMWLGQVILRKGIQYLMEAARRLEGRDIRFVIVGPVRISEEAVASAPGNMTFTGRVTRDRARRCIARLTLRPADDSDGFAIARSRLRPMACPCRHAQSGDGERWR